MLISVFFNSADTRIPIVSSFVMVASAFYGSPSSFTNSWLDTLMLVDYHCVSMVNNKLRTATVNKTLKLAKDDKECARPLWGTFSKPAVRKLTVTAKEPAHANRKRQ